MTDTVNRYESAYMSNIPTSTENELQDVQHIVQHEGKLLYQMQTQPSNKLVWTGHLKWQEVIEPGKSMSRVLPCQARIFASETLNTDVWPSTLQVQLIPQTYLHSLNRFLKTAKTVTFSFSASDSDVLQAMCRVMNCGSTSGNLSGSTPKFSGCIILNPPNQNANPPNHNTNPPNHVHVMLLLYNSCKKTFIGVIPDEQQSFVSELRAIISADKNRAKHQQNRYVTSVVPPIMNPQVALHNQSINDYQITNHQIPHNSCLFRDLTTNNIQQELSEQNQYFTMQQRQILLAQQQQQKQLQQQHLQPDNVHMYGGFMNSLQEQ